MFETPKCPNCKSSNTGLVVPRREWQYFYCHVCAYEWYAYVDGVHVRGCPTLDEEGCTVVAAPEESEEHWLGLPVGITVGADKRVRICVDLGDAYLDKNYDDEVTEAFLVHLAGAIAAGNYDVVLG